MPLSEAREIAKSLAALFTACHDTGIPISLLAAKSGKRAKALTQLNEACETLEKDNNGLRELGQEMHRILWHMTKAQKFDLLPDWFAPRLRLLVPLPDDLMLTPEESAPTTDGREG